MTPLLSLTARSVVMTGSGPRAAVTVTPGETITFGPGLARVVRETMRTVLVRDAGQRARWPIAVPAGSLGGGFPVTDLFVIPEQILALADGLGAPARFLVDGTIIRRAAPQGALDLVTFHLDAPLATPAPDSVLPGLIETLAATRLPPAGPPQGSIDLAQATHVDGWACDPTRPGQPLLLAIEVDGGTGALVLADRFRDDLDRDLPGGGHHAFHATFAQPLDRQTYHHVTLRRAFDGAPVTGAELLVDRAPALGPALAAIGNLAPEARARALSDALAALGEAPHG